ncbi:kinase [Fusarium agapanthi]|uniref:Kinase n=1 Tax=Fusarium agapanthi TaxID=1803897 RepID=A0A9P5B463_9HYPO|nr:kinase [Fusarium agapanthi]
MNESIATILERLRRRAANNAKSFFIFEEVRDSITERLIAEAIAPHVPDHRHKEVVLDVLHNGVRLFSILSLMESLELISEFISHRALDNRLPLTDKAELLRIAPGSDSFFDLQWEFFPWAFEKDCGHLIFSDATILPFLSDQQIGEGADGEISVVTIPAPLQDFSLVEKNDTVTIVRKRIKAASNLQRTVEKFDKERECLELFHTLQHPNIIPLLGSFTISGYHSLLFPYYSLDLPTFLSKERSGAFSDHIIFVAAISALASALQVVHEVNLRSRTQPIYATSYGYHHDIRPANILVSETTFILADFGLAYPKLPITETPPFAKWSENIGSYIAPECMDDLFEPQVIGRSYDIWAFGCLLSELTTYLEQGPEGIEKFRAQRTTKLYYKIPWENSYFFQGDVTTKTTTLKDGVSRWLEELADAPQEFITPLLVGISKQMLHPEVADRPSMPDVTAQLGLVHVRLLFHSAVERIEKTLAELGRSRLEASSHTSTELLIELSKLKAVGDVFGLTKTTQACGKQFSAPSFTRFVQDCLQQIRTAISESRASLSEYRPVWTVNKSLAGVTKELRPVKPIAVVIRPSITSLCESISDQQNFNQFFYSHFLSHVKSEGALKDTEACAEDSPMIFGDVGIHAKFRRLNMALQRKTDMTNNSELILNWDQVNGQRNFSRNHHLALYDDKKVNNGGPKQVLIEWIFFSQFPDGELEESRIQRLFDLAELLHTPKPPDFRVLDCHGFLPPKGDGMKGYGFVYPFPTLPDLAPAMVQPRTLRQMFDDRLSNWSLSLGDKFAIAKALANSLCHLHRHEWLHKNIRSENVILFVDESDRRLKGGPYFIGFHHGRKDEDKFCSDVPSVDSDPEALLYQHPDYNYGNTRFRKDHDRYSLGIILLELAYWKQVVKMRQQEGDTTMSETSLGLSWDGASLPPPSEVISNVIIDNIKSSSETTPLPILALLTRLVHTLSLHRLKEYEFSDFVSEGVPLGEGATYEVIHVAAEPADAMNTRGPVRVDMFAMKIAKVNIPRSLKRVRMSDEEYHRLRVVLFEIELLSHPAIQKHPNIAVLAGFVWDERILGYAPCLIMEAAKFGNARQFTSRRDLTKQEKLSICRDVAAGLDFLHSSAIVHGDIKLDNVLVYSEPKSKTGFISKISDFERSPQSGNGSRYLGTKSYNAPEVQRGSTSLCPKDLWRCDVFSFGLLTLEVLSGCSQYEQIPGGKELQSQVHSGGSQDLEHAAANLSSKLERGKAAYSMFLCYVLGEYTPLKSACQALEYVTSAVESGYEPAVILGKRIFEANGVSVPDAFVAKPRDPRTREFFEELDRIPDEEYFKTAVQFLWPAKLRSEAIGYLEGLCPEGLSQQDLASWMRDKVGQIGAPAFRELAESSLLLHYAVSQSNYKACEALVGLGCNINSQTSDGITPVHLAMRCAEVALVKFLLNHGADASIAAHNAVSPLHWAVVLPDGQVADIVTKLVQNIAHDRRISTCKMLTVFEDVGLRLRGAPHHWAVWCRSLTALKVLTDPSLFPSRKPEFLVNILYCAIGIGCCETIKYLFQFDDIRHQALNCDEYKLCRDLGVIGTPLSRWLMFGRSHDTYVCETIDTLSSFGMRLPLRSKREPASADWRPLTRASMGSHVHVMKELIHRGADVNETHWGTSVLEWTLDSGGFCGRSHQHAEAVELLLSHGAKTHHEPVLHRVSRSDVSIDVFLVVLRDRPAEINMKFKGTIPLLLLLERSIKRDIYAKVQALVQAGSLLNTEEECARTTPNGGDWMCCQTALSHSLYAMNWGIANYLLNCGASVECGVHSGHHKTVLHILIFKASQTDWDTSQGKTEMFMRILGDLVSHPKAKEQDLIHRVDYKGTDALGHATYLGLPHVVRILLDRRHGISSEAVDKALAMIPSLLSPALKPRFVDSDRSTASARVGLREFRRYKVSEYKERLERIQELLESFDRT